MYLPVLRGYLDRLWGFSAPGDQLVHRTLEPTLGRILAEERYLLLSENAEARALHMALGQAISSLYNWAMDLDRGGNVRARDVSLHVIATDPASWYLFWWRDALFLDARYSWSAVLDDSLLVRLDHIQVAAYRAHGARALDELQRAIQDSSPHTAHSPYGSQDLYRGADGAQWRAAVEGAISKWRERTLS
ncbi:MULTISPECIES: hypothetical protein [Arthrobacter]|uniref:CdiI immunity protein domain-containing protein n=2 Tax=Arthrobacter TaxID=1663 RepID=A0ABU9KLL4_9MICC|nr:hypothetical protein [Arthrobacter sp. YJM1]MDP5227796.1 hypothetical protein [Arthrobacter sp. YJM1]